MPQSVNDAKAAYATYVGTYEPYSIALEEIQSLGARPEFNGILATDAEYDTIVANQAAWDAAIPALRTSLISARQDMRNAELATIAACYPNQWVHLVKGDGPIFDVYVGYNDVQNPILVVLQSEPSDNFPNL